MQFITPLPFTEALEKLDQRTLQTSGLDSALWSRVPVALRERAFFSARVESAQFLRRARTSIAAFLQSAREPVADTGETALVTGSRADFIKQMQDFAIAEGMGPLDPKDAGTIKDITSERRLGLIFDTQTAQASDYGWWQQGQDPDVLEEFPAQRFIREVPAKEPRSLHQDAEGMVRLKSDLNFWLALNQDFGVPWGPWGWGCGHAVEDVDRDTAEALGLIKPGEPVQPAQESLNTHLQASTQNLDPDLVQMLRAEFGPRVEITAETIRWTE